MPAYGLPIILLVMLLKEAGVPIPVPGDVIMLGAAARAASGEWSLPAVIATFEVALVAGGTVQYLLARGPGRALLYRFGPYVGLTPSRLERAAGALRKGGPAAVAVAMCTPGVRAATIAASGVADLSFAAFFPALVVGDSVFFALHLAVGYAGGRGLKAVLHGHAGFGPVLLAVLALLLVLGLAGWLMLRRRVRRPDAREGSGSAVLGAWAEASCPLCLALGALRPEPA
jgi:membrane protein DedA with SNARE-associated domain